MAGYVLLSALVGLFLGAWLLRGEGAIFGLFAGMVAGWLFGRQRALTRRLREIEARLGALSAETTPAAAGSQAASIEEVSRARGAGAAKPTSGEPSPDAMSEGPPPFAGSERAESRATFAVGDSPSALAAEAESAVEAGLVSPPPGAPFSGFGDRMRLFFSDGNVPVKVGMIVLLAGVAALLDYASDEGWLRFPIELRLAGIAATAIGALLFGFYERERRRTFGLSLQGGAIGILVLTIFAAFRLYELLPATFAFGLLVVLVFGGSLLALLQNSLSLAILAAVAGFAAPILVSRGGGNHVALFGWYAILDLALLGMAWRKTWRSLHLLGFVGTFGVATTWGVLRYEPSNFSSVEPFLLLFFSIFLAIPILQAARGNARSRIDGTLVFGNPLIAFALQAGMLADDVKALALSALSLALLYVGLAWVLRTRLRLLAESFAVVAVSFATLTVPLALDARSTASVFAAEGTALVWLGLRQGSLLQRLSGLGLQMAAAAIFLVGDLASDALPLANALLAGSLLLVAGLALSAWIHQRVGRTFVASLYFCGALLYWLFAWAREIEHFTHEHPLLAFFTPLGAPIVELAVTSWLCAEAFALLARRARRDVGASPEQPGAEGEVDRERGAPILPIASALLLLPCLPLALFQRLDGNPFAGGGAVAWALFALLGLRAQLAFTSALLAGRALHHLAFIGGICFSTGLALHEAASSLGSGWSDAALVLPTIVALAFAALRPAWLLTGPWRPALVAALVAALLGAFFASTIRPGDAAPAAYLPLLNPLELSALAYLALLALGLGGLGVKRRGPFLAPLLFLLLSAATLRAVHQLLGLPWEDSLLSADATQASLSVVWSIAGVAGWIAGSRRGERGLWLVGALLMGLVLAKLVLVDRQFLGNLAGIVSFLAYGTLCTVVGYLAPVPPRREAR